MKEISFYSQPAKGVYHELVLTFVIQFSCICDLKKNKFIISIYFGCFCSLLWCTGFSLRWLLVTEHGLQVRGLQQLWLESSRAQAQQLWPMGLVAPRHVGSSWTRARTRVPCIGRQIPNHCATREAHICDLDQIMFLLFFC